ncbi:MAG: NUDIX domain-containing protein [Candidatus Mycalebacterium zealandia]|nr:MAG: NUDIX domain-containing protein [Candidatus Mycalebacterium zealandia]
MSAESGKVYRKAGVVVRRSGEDGEDEILLVSARRHAGSWVFPAGTVEDGEIPEQTAVRECAEESGYVVKIGDEIGTVTVSEGEWTKNFTFFSGTVTAETESKEQDRQVKWIGVSDLESEIVAVFAPIARNVKR